MEILLPPINIIITKAHLHKLKDVFLILYTQFGSTKFFFNQSNHMDF